MAAEGAPERYSADWVIGTITRKLHGCFIVNHDVFVHKSAYIGEHDTKIWFDSLQAGDAVEFTAEAHDQGRNRWRAIEVRDPPSYYRSAARRNSENSTTSSERRHGHHHHHHQHGHLTVPTSTTTGTTTTTTTASIRTRSDTCESLTDGDHTDIVSTSTMLTECLSVADCMSDSSTADRPLSPAAYGQATQQQAAATMQRELFVHVLQTFLASGDYGYVEAQLQQMSGTDWQSEFISCAVRWALEPPANDPRVMLQALFLRLHRDSFLQAIHFRVAWIVVGYALEHASNAIGPVHHRASELLGHGIYFNYLSMDALRVILAPLKPSGKALTLALLVLKNLLSRCGPGALACLYAQSTFDLTDITEHVRGPELVAILRDVGLGCIAIASGGPAALPGTAVP